MWCVFGFFVEDLYDTQRAYRRLLPEDQTAGEMLSTDGFG